MLKPHHAGRPIVWATLLICVCLFMAGSNALAQAPSSVGALPDRERGIELYKQGNDLEAIATLRRAVKQDKNDLSAWRYLGLALNRQGQPNDARQAHEKAAKIGEKLMLQQYEDPTPSISSERLMQLISLVKEAADSADQYLELIAKPPKKKITKAGKLQVITFVEAKPSKETYEWRERAELLREFSWWADHTGAGKPDQIKSSKEVMTKARILSRPEPQYTEEARQNQAAGTVVLKAVFAADGRVRAIRVIAGLPYGLTMAAIRAARRIEFIPAMINAIPVSQFIQIEYNFNRY